MADAVVSFVVGRLGQLLVDQVVLLQGMKDEVRWLKKKLEWMLSFLKDAEDKQDENSLIRQWVYDVRDVAHDAEDTVDNFILKIEEGGASIKIGFKTRFAKYFCICSKDGFLYKQTNLYGIGTEITNLKKRIKEIQENQLLFQIKSIDDAREGSSRVNERFKQLRRERPYDDDDENLVGFKEDTTTLLSELLKKVPHRLVISIVGMGGLGKTTLARKLYKTGSFKFDCSAWVSVSKEYNIKDLLQRIIKSFKIPTCKEEWEMLDGEEDLELHLRKYLEGRSYLVVMDDVWDTEAWACLRRAFPDKKNGSRVIITTRNKVVAERIDENTYVHELPVLKDEESWELFCKKAFPNHDGVDAKTSSCPHHLETLARNMVNKCRGLPLAIVVLGGLLSRKQHDEWPKLQAHIWRHVRHDSPHVQHVWSSSFNDLPHHMKSCFLYFGLFPEDYDIDVQRLIRMWVAEGFILPGEQEMEEAAMECLNELVDRNLIEIGRRTWRRIQTCRIHDLLRDFAIEKSKELNFLHICDGNTYSAHPPKSRRQASHFGLERFVSLDHSNSYLRTLLFFNEESDSSDMEKLEVLFTKLRLLRVLDFGRISFDPFIEEREKIRLPDAIGKNIHLRYLNMGSTFIDELPPCIGNLQALQTLEVPTENERAISLPHQIYNAKQLRHLIGDFGWPFRVDNLTNLRTLKWVWVNDQMEFNPMDLVNLRELYVFFLGNRKRFNLESICRLRNLQTFHLVVRHKEDDACSSLDNAEASYFPALQTLSHCQHLLQLKINGQIGRLPLEMHEFLPNLMYLYLEQYKSLEDDPMPILEKLPKLTILDLYCYTANKITCTAGAFPCLEILQLFYCEIEELQVDEGGMPVIKGLRVDCGYVRKISERLRSIPTPKNWEIPHSEDDWPY